MPKGATSRPLNRTERRALNVLLRERNRSDTPTEKDIREIRDARFTLLKAFQKDLDRGGYASFERAGLPSSRPQRQGLREK